MILFSTLDFFLVLAVVVFIAIILGLCGRQLNLFSALTSVVFVLLIFKYNIPGLIAFAVYISYQGVLIAGYLKLKRKQSTAWWLWLFVALSLAPLLVLRFCALFRVSTIEILGISYLMFKEIQMLIEIHDGLISTVRIRDYLGFMLFFPTLLSGPIDRSRRFLADQNVVMTRAEYLDLVSLGLWKFLKGALYKFVFSGLVYYFLEKVVVTGMSWKLIPYMYLYGFYLFFDFAGYSSMAIGISYILKIRTPENFNKPFISTDLIDFWTRWNITLSTWFRDYIFSRVMMFMMKHRSFKKRVTMSSVAYIINMSLMGLWHGFSTDYIVYGLYHGLLLMLNERFRHTKFYRAHHLKRWYKCCAIVVTFNVIMFGFLIFSGQLISSIVVSLGA